MGAGFSPRVRVEIHPLPAKAGTHMKAFVAIFGTDAWQYNQMQVAGIFLSWNLRPGTCYGIFEAYIRVPDDIRELKIV